VKGVDVALPDGLKADVAPIGLEALRIYESALFSSQGQFEQAKIWRAFNLWLGVPAAVLAALAGSAILGGHRSGSFLGLSLTAWAGIFALLAAACSATLTTVNASRRATQSQSSANAFLQLQTEARQLVTIDLATFTRDEARAALDSITNSRNELSKTADPPGALAYRRAKKNIYVTGGQAYEVDNPKGAA
jgi:hypothetical protein